MIHTVIHAAEVFLYINTGIAMFMAISGLPRPKFLQHQR